MVKRENARKKTGKRNLAIVSDYFAYNYNEHENFHVNLCMLCVHNNRVYVPGDCFFMSYRCMA